MPDNAPNPDPRTPSLSESGGASEGSDPIAPIARSRRDLPSRHRRTLMIGGWVLVVAATPFAAYVVSLDRLIPYEKLHHASRGLTYNPWVAFGLLPLGLLFGAFTIGCFAVRRPGIRWTIAVAAWGLTWSFFTDAAVRGLVALDKQLCRAGWIAWPTGDSGLVERMDIHVPVALIIASIVTAVLTGWATRSRTVFLVAAVASVLPATFILVPDLPNSSYGAATLWMGAIAAVLLNWVAGAPPSFPHCPACSYDLTGNTTGVCPECGKPRQLGAGAAR